MSYQALARKWRPKRFDQVVGQPHVVSALCNALDNQQVHHAFLFAGTRGVGKTTLARIFAKALNCEQGISSTPCGHCAACSSVDQGNFVDLIEVDAASRTKVDDTRELLDNVQYAPTLGRIKTYLIDEVHMLSTHSFNALLKTLEEPPEHVKFLLATTDPQKLPPTILSRCIQFNLKSVDLPDLSAQFAQILTAEELPYESAALETLARSANGSVRDGLSLLDQAIAYGNGTVKSDSVRAMLGMIDNQYVLDLLASVLQRQTAAALQTVADMSRRSVDYLAVLDELLSTIHALCLLQVDPAAAEWKGLDLAALSALAADADAELLQLLYQIGLIGKRDMPLSPDPRSGFEMVLLRMLVFQPAAAAGSAQPPATGGFAAPPPVPAVSKTPTAAAPASAVSQAPAAAPVDSAAARASAPPSGEVAATDLLQKIQSAADWADFINRCGADGMTRQMMLHMLPQSDGARGRMIFLLDEQYRNLSNPARIARVAALISEHAGRQIRVEVTVGSLAALPAKTPSQQQQQQQQERDSAAQQAFYADENVQQLIEAFDAEVIPGSIRPGAA